jgi:hypothetical protein
MRSDDGPYVRLVRRTGYRRYLGQVADRGVAKERRLRLGVHRRPGEVLPGLRSVHRAAHRALLEGEGEVTQLELFAEVFGGGDVPAPDTRLSNAEAGIRKDVPAGPGRLIAALVRGGLQPADLAAAAELVLALEEEAKP